MSNSEKNSFIQFLVAESYKKDQQIDRLQQTIDAQGERQSVMQLTLDKIESAQHATRDENIKLNAQLSRQGASLKSMQSELKKSLREAAKHRGLYEVLRDEKFVGTSQKSGKSRSEAGRDDDKDDWTGTGNTVDDESSSETDKECSGPTDEGSRSRKELTDYIEDTDIAALQSDAYTVYKYLDGELSEVEHIHYLKNAWTPVMAYRNDGRYCIDNSIAEHSIRTLTIERKNKMAFGSHQGAETSTVYHTFVATCKMGALSFYKFLKNYLTAFMEGRTDFENLTPAILGKIN